MLLLMNPINRYMSYTINHHLYHLSCYNNSKSIGGIFHAGAQFNSGASPSNHAGRM